MTLTPGRDSTFGSTFADLLADFTSDFLFVTGAFDCTDTGFAATLAAGVFAAALLGELATLVLAATAFAWPADLTATTFFSTVLLDFTVAADLALLAVSVWVFAGFFIAFAIGSTTKVMLLKRG
ncbi:hypothetical protein [Herminiimonas sp. KBW02]|uniref:hypothetical protein n=1 Tax=Herminiimonas sp. KBW02 TaxID=2153363 RepID=UPI001F1C0824|nr:hypothetical protein [Herminiimonas sp. KBW02]